MRSERGRREYHTPSELERQVESCTIADYDVNGWCYVNVLAGPPSPIRYEADGPTLRTGDPTFPFVEILLWTDKSGLLESVEVVDYVGGLTDVYRTLVEAAAAFPEQLTYRYQK